MRSTSLPQVLGEKFSYFLSPSCLLRMDESLNHNELAVSMSLALRWRAGFQELKWARSANTSPTHFLSWPISESTNGWSPWMIPLLGYEAVLDFNGIDPWYIRSLGHKSGLEFEHWYSLDEQR